MVADDARLSARMGVARSAVEVYDGQKHQFRVDFGNGGQVISYELSPEQKAIGFKLGGEMFQAVKQ